MQFVFGGTVHVLAWPATRLMWSTIKYKGTHTTIRYTFRYIFAAQSVLIHGSVGCWLLGRTDPRNFNKHVAVAVAVAVQQTRGAEHRKQPLCQLPPNNLSVRREQTLFSTLPKTYVWHDRQILCFMISNSPHKISTRSYCSSVYIRESIIPTPVSFSFLLSHTHTLSLRQQLALYPNSPTPLTSIKLQSTSSRIRTQAPSEHRLDTDSYTGTTRHLMSSFIKKLKEFIK